jgi:uncharacterized protein
MDNQPAVPAIPVEVRPVATADRIKSIDMIRGVALLGILLMNIPGFGVDQSIYRNVVDGDHTNPDYYTLAGMIAFFEGTMRGLFSMLFGAGMVLFSMKKIEMPGQPGMADYYYRRLLWLLAFGLLNAYVLLWPGDILYFYALGGMVLFCFRKFKPKWLILLGIVCIGIGLLKGQLQWDEMRDKRETYLTAKADQEAKKEISGEQQGVIAEWSKMQERFKPDTAEINKNVRKVRGSYSVVFGHLRELNANIEIWGFYNGIWDILSMMFIGMGLFKLGFFSNKSATSTYVMLLLLGYGLGIPLGWAYFKGNEAWIMDFENFVDSWRMPPFANYDLRRIFLCLGHASLLMLVLRSKIVPWLMKALAAVGQMAFTNYLMQTIICTLIFYGYGLGNYNKLRFHELYFVVLAIWIFQLIFSSIWLRYFRFGPFEWLWRSLTYWKKQPMKN